jgi:hypothetical protein
MIFVNQFRAPVLNAINVSDHDGNDRFIISLGDGSIQCTNASFQILFDVPSKNGDFGLRDIISFKNPFKDDKLGDFLIMTDGSMLNISMWIKDGSFVVNKGPSKHHGNHHNPHFHHNNNGFNQNFRGKRGGGKRGNSNF